MKKVVLSLVLLAGTVSYVSAQSSFGIQAGIALASVKAEQDDEEIEFDSKIGLTLGVYANVGLSDNFSFRPALNFVQKGAKNEMDIFGTTVKTTVNLNYIEVPFNFVYTSAPGSGFFIGAGPSLSFGLSGKTKSEADGQEEEEDLNFGDGDDEVKRLEFGGNILAGYQMTNGFNVSLNYNIGFSNLSNVDNSSWKNNYFGIRLGYGLGGEKK